MERTYSKTEVDLKLKNFEEKNDAWNGSIMQKLDDIHKHMLEPILEQVKATNGRVTSLEETRAEQKGGAKVLKALLALFIAFMVWVATQIIALNQDRAITEALLAPTDFNFTP